MKDTMTDNSDHPMLRESMKKILVPEVYEYFIAMMDYGKPKARNNGTSR